MGGFELFDGGGVGGEAVGLAEGGAGPIEAEPAEVGFDGRVEFFADAGVVDVFEAEEEDSDAGW